MPQLPSPYWNYGELGPRFGISELPPPAPAELARREADRRAFRASPRGRFLAALDRLAELPRAAAPCPAAAAAAAARSAYSRGFSAAASVDPPELACARRELQSLGDHPEAVDALAALDEIAAERLPSPADAA